MNVNRRANNRVQKNFKDYLAPIVIIAVISILVLNYMFSSPSTTTNPVGDTSFLTVSLADSDSKWTINSTKWDKTDLVAWENKVYKTQTIQATNWTINITLASSWGSMVLDRLWELKYSDNGSFYLYASNLWANLTSDTTIEMKYAKVQASAWSVFSLSQNEISSSIYVVSGNVSVSNSSNSQTSLTKWESIVIMRDSADSNTDISTLKTQIQDYIKTDDWFVKNNWAFYLSQIDSASTLSWSTLSWSVNTWSLNSISWSTSQTYWDAANAWGYISFDNLYDEAQISTDSLDVEWNVLSDNVNTIEINGQNADIDAQTKKFSLKWLKVTAKSNDIVYKIYDASSNLLYKWVLTLYYTDWTATSNTDSSLAQVQNYPISTSDTYKIISPKANPYTTSDSVVKIEWTVPYRTVEKIVINDFTLQKFTSYGSYWSYFANTWFGNLKDWVNIYKIQYYGANNKLLFENNFTIIKQAWDNASTWTTKPVVTYPATTYPATTTDSTTSTWVVE